MNRHSGSPRREATKAALAALLAASLAGTALTGGANAAPRGDIVDFAVGEPRFDRRLTSYGFADDSDTVVAPIPIGSNTEEIVIQPTDAAADPTVECSYTADSGSTVTRREVTAAQWLAGEMTLPVDGAGVQADSPEQFRVWCVLEKLSDTGYSVIGWDLVPQQTAAERLTLTQDPALLRWEEMLDGYESPSSPRSPIRAGGTVRVIGAAGTWPTPHETSGTYASLWTDTPPWGYMNFDDVDVSPDGSTLTIDLPAEMEPGLLGRDDVTVSAMVASDYFVDGVRSASQRTTSWQATVAVSAEHASVTTLSAGSRFALSFRGVTATARVRIDGSPASEGTVAFSVDGQYFRDVALSAGTEGRVSVGLPDLGRGPHTVTATYSGTTGVSPSSTTTRFRVLF